MQSYWHKRKRIHEKRFQLPWDWFGTPTWPPFYCFRRQQLGRREVMCKRLYTCRVMRFDRTSMTEVFSASSECKPNPVSLYYVFYFLSQEALRVCRMHGSRGFHRFSGTSVQRPYCCKESPFISQFPLIILQVERNCGSFLLLCTSEI